MAKETLREGYMRLAKKYRVNTHLNFAEEVLELIEASASSPSNDMAELAKAKKLVDDAEKDLKLLVDSDLNMAAWGTSNPHINRARRDILTIRGELIRASEKLNLIAHPEKRGPVA